MGEHSAYHFLKGLGKGLDERLAPDSKSTQEEFGDLLDKLGHMISSEGQSRSSDASS